MQREASVSSSRCACLPSYWKVSVGSGSLGVQVASQIAHPGIIWLPQSRHLRVGQSAREGETANLRSQDGSRATGSASRPKHGEGVGLWALRDGTQPSQGRSLLADPTRNELLPPQLDFPGKTEKHKANQLAVEFPPCQLGSLSRTEHSPSLLLSHGVNRFLGLLQNNSVSLFALYVKKFFKLLIL